ncbi:hypothetical protein BYT27DRAFT_7090090 [Phlegmacium glaucopus]|nr:hypothetical protein BYT27DRAFT_7090090 [Phlegmacium glaucopus]
MNTNSSNNTVPSNLIAFPSVSSSLYSLPQATSIHNVALHPNMYAQRAQESEEKLRNALSKTPSSFTPQPQQTVYRVQVSIIVTLLLSFH